MSKVGNHYFVKNAPYNAVIPSGGSVLVGAVANFSMPGTLPTGFSLNGSSSVVPALAVSSGVLKSATQGVPYSETLVATGGTAPYSWMVPSCCACPSGLTLSSSGVVSGTATLAGNYTFKVMVTDSTSATATRYLTLNVAAAPVVTPPGYSSRNSSYHFADLGGGGCGADFVGFDRHCHYERVSFRFGESDC